MWLLTGPFDSESGDGVTTTKTKLLKTGRKIALGRRDRPLLVNNKKISRDHCEFTVGPCTQDDMPNPSFVPTLEIYNTKEKPMSIDRDGQAIIVNSSSSCELKSGDKINIVVGISVQVHWRRIACFLPPARSLPSISSEDCAAIGISLITSPSSLATHHLTPKYELTVPLVTSLLSATQLVKVEWLQELIRLGTTSDDGHPLKLAPLEQSFTPPLESKYRPIFSPSLASPLKSFKFWEPNEERLHLLKGYRFVLLCDAEGQVDEYTRELIIRGDGEYECFPLTNGEAKWRQMLAKAKRKVDGAGLKVAIVTREHVVQAAVGADKWREMTAEAQSLSLPLINLDTLLNAVINTDASLINEWSSSQGGVLAESESPLPDFVPNTHPDEPSLPVAPEKASTEPNDIRRKSPSPSPPPVLFGLPIPPPPSKTLIRRTKPLSTTSRAEESVVSNVKGEAQAENLGYTLPPLPVMTRSTKLKRRTPARTPPPIEEPVAANEGNEEPPLKKFKALFDASDPDKMTVDPDSLRDTYDTAMGDSVGLTQAGESLTQSDSRPPHSQRAAPPRRLEVVAEEEEESCHSRAAPTLPRAHRKSPILQEASESHVDATQDPGTSGRAPSKKTKSKPAQSHQIDTDPAFLTALASRKGKKSTEDGFDREFNKLRISKPDIHREEGEQAWEILGDFDIETRNLRGNFMVVIDMEVFRRNSGPGDTAGATRTYDGRPNFKKFKKTPTPWSRAPIELVARAEHDYGVGLGYWKDSAPKDQDTLAPTQTAGTQKRRAPTVLESDDAGTDVPAAKTTKRAPRKAAQSKASAAAEKLFLNSDEEDSVPITDQGPIGKSHTGKIDPVPDLPTRGSKRRHIVVDDDSDDGVAFKGFSRRKRVR
ncbi:hypothetical protein J3R83DRAFT_9435 [Lanmaoa asiatica]|nr:hypothetical protein J3R83DRAFT_9435 [Lanmaoa asiatica]